MIQGAYAAPRCAVAGPGSRSQFFPRDGRGRGARNGEIPGGRSRQADASDRRGDLSDRQALGRGAGRPRCWRCPELVPVVERNQPQAVLAVATSALREANNGRRVPGRGPRAVRPRRPASSRATRRRGSAYAGARARLGGDRGERIALFDLGGGSLEMVVGEGARILHARSAPIGVLRAVGANPLSNPPTPRELRALEQWARRQVSALVEPGAQAAGSVRSSCAPEPRAPFAPWPGSWPSCPPPGPGADRLRRRARCAWLIDWLAPLPLGARRDRPGARPRPGRSNRPRRGHARRRSWPSTGVASARVCRAALREGLVLEHVSRLAAPGARARRRRGLTLAA